MYVARKTKQIFAQAKLAKSFKTDRFQGDKFLKINPAACRSISDKGTKRIIVAESENTKLLFFVPCVLGHLYISSLCSSCDLRARVSTSFTRKSKLVKIGMAEIEKRERETFFPSVFLFLSLFVGSLVPRIQAEPCTVFHLHSPAAHYEMSYRKHGLSQGK